MIGPEASSTVSMPPLAGMLLEMTGEYACVLLINRKPQTLMPAPARDPDFVVRGGDGQCAVHRALRLDPTGAGQRVVAVGGDVNDAGSAGLREAGGRLVGHGEFTGVGRLTRPTGGWSGVHGRRQPSGRGNRGQTLGLSLSIHKMGWIATAPQADSQGR